MKKRFIILSIFFSHALYAETLPQINVDNFDRDAMEKALEDYGTIEVIGPSIDRLRAQAENTLKKAEEILTLDSAILDKVKHASFNGYQNVRQETENAHEKAKAEGKKDLPIIRNQIAYHFRPYLGEKIPESIEHIQEYHDYYTSGLNVLRAFYEKIAKAFIPHLSNRSSFDDDVSSVLTSRLYFSTKDEGQTGIPAHSDYGLLTLVVSNADGLEVLHNGQWIKASCRDAQNQLRFFINVGDWLMFQTGNKKFKAGIHRVPSVNQNRFSLALFLNPAYDQKIETFSGKEAPFKEFLMSDKSAFWIQEPLRQ